MSLQEKNGLSRADGAGGAPENRMIEISVPDATDGADVFDLIAACPPLDQNSMYANLLQCSHFASTCAVAKEDGRALGWISGYVPPEMPDTYFLWQVAVHADARGQRLPKRLLKHIFDRPALEDLRYLNTTITRDNEASWGFFRSIARWLETDLTDREGFDKDRHFKGRHDSEILVTIGPFNLPPPAL